MAASRQEIDLIVEAITKGFDKVVADMGKVEKSTKKSGDEAKRSGLKWTELKSGLDLAQQAYGKIAQAAEFAYTSVKEGAQLNLAAAQFDNLAGSINTTSDSLLNNLRTATKGMVSDAELITGATDIINLGLGKTEEETVRLATAVSTLGLDMQQVILTFANNSKARLDALGLSVEGVTTKAAELEAQGFQGDAFDEAVLIGLEEKMTLFGDASETTAGQLQMLEADWANLTNMAKQFAAEMAGPVISAVTKDIQVQKQLTEAYQQGILTWGEWHKLSVESRRAGGLNIETNERYAEVLEALNEELARSTVRTNEQARAMEISAQLAAQNAVEFAALTEHLRATAEGAGELSGAQAMLNSEMSTGGERIEYLGGRAGEVAARMALLAEATAEPTGAINNLGGAVDRTNIQLQKLLDHMATLDGRSATATVDVTVAGLPLLERAQMLWNDLASMGAATTKIGGGAKGGSGAVGSVENTNIPPTGIAGGAKPGNVINQTNNFNNAQNPAATANEVANQLGKL